MKRIAIRLSVLSLIVGLGLIAIAQARYGMSGDAADTVPDQAGAEIELPNGAPQPIAVESPSEVEAAFDVSENPLRGGDPFQRDDIPQEPAPLGAVPGARPIPRYSEETAPARVVLASNDAAPAPRYADATPGLLQHPDDEEPASLPDARDNLLQRDEAAPAAQLPHDQIPPGDYRDASSDIPDAGAAPVVLRSDPGISPQRPATPLHAGSGRPGPKTLEGPQAPSLTVEKTAPAEIKVGKPCTFDIIVTNSGQTAAHQVVLQDRVPEGTRLISTNPPGAVDGGGQISWELGDLEPGRRTKIQMELMPTDEGEIGSVATVHFQAQASVRTRATRPRLELRLSATPKVLIGDTVRLDIEISNPGSGAATGVILLENVPDGMTHPAGKSLEFEVGTLQPGETRKMDLTLTAAQAGVSTNILSARADANLEATQQVDVEVIAPQLDVAIEGPQRRYLERQATYVLSVANPGTAPARDIELVSYLPQGMKFVRANNQGQYDPQSHSVAWGLDELPAHQTGSVEVVAMPTEAGSQQIRVEGKAQQGLADKAEQTVEVEGIAAILFVVADISDPIEVGGETTYEIRVTNQGSKAASDIVVSADLPPDLKAISANGPTRHGLEPGRVVFAPLARLAPKADTTYQVKVQATGPGDQRFRVQLISAEMRMPVTKEESTRVYSDQ